jgi:hypothetical protein
MGIKRRPYTEGITRDFIAFCAPRVDTMTTAAGDKYNFCTGTLMTAAFVTGAVALLLPRYPDLKLKQERSFLEKSATDLGVWGLTRQRLKRG